ncbi:MAG: sigma-54 dependent transcriptional regulator [Erythrobacter sp.]|jgi:DNA-binding NtrC family response regulator|nr:sigma-54 dependent transcriptional regulator [Erythrobacter sp.]
MAQKSEEQLLSDGNSGVKKAGAQRCEQQDPVTDGVGHITEGEAGRERSLLLIDDEPQHSRLLSAIAAREGWRTVLATDDTDALRIVGTRDGNALCAVILDQWTPDGETCELIGRLREVRPTLPIIMLTASTSPQLAVEAMRAGACDYLVKPVSPDRLMAALRAAASAAQPRDELAPLTEKLSVDLDFDTMVGAAPNFRTALAQAAKAARGHGHALVEGESGTGKEMVLRAMHAASPRAREPMRIIHLASIVSNAAESALFGHEPNAFPGAFDRHLGALQHCDGGTLILDEVDRLNPALQTRLNDALETGIVRPLGATHGFRVDVRILSSTTVPLAALVSEHRFDAKLAERLSATHITVPPLRERSGDIPALTRFFLQRIGEQPGIEQLSIAEQAMRLLKAYQWPGNVRQLQSVLFRAAVYCEGDMLGVENFPQIADMVGDIGPAKPNANGQGRGVMIYNEDGHLRPLEEIEADVIRLAIGHYRGRMTEVARRLGIGRSTLYRKLADLGIDSAA